MLRLFDIISVDNCISGNAPALLSSLIESSKQETVEIMVGLIAAAFVGLTLFGISSKIVAWRRNYKIALTSSFPVFYSPLVSRF